MFRILFLLFLLAAPTTRPVPRENQLPAPVRDVLVHADTLELLSLDPGRPGRPAAMPLNAFHGWTVLGRTTIQDATQRKAVVGALDRGVAEGAFAARCFDPRHGVRAMRGKTVVELVICFECRQIEAFVDGKEAGSALTSPSPKAPLDRALREAKIPLAGDLKP
jgi:hypothetical protein